MAWRHVLDRDRNEELAVIASAAKDAIAELRPEQGVLVINNLHVTVNYASGGGATINVKATP